ncbi:MAG: NACHT domain-containing protein [Saprospiraceae bacterium]
MLESSIEIGAEIFFSLVKKAYAGIAGYAQERDFFKTATKKYIKNLRDDFGEVRVLGMKERVRLESLYVRANVLEKLQIRSGDLPEEMEQNRAMFLSAFGKTLETVDGEEIVNKDENLMVLGKPGAGKTTYLKYLTLRMTSKDKGSKIKQRRLPIFVTLHEFAKSGKPLLDYMVEQFGLCGFEDAKSFIERMLSNGDCIVLLDGLDEVSRETSLDTVIQEVTDFTRRYRESRFVVSCRVAAYNHSFPKFKEVEIADFNKAQIEDFVGKYFQKEHETGRDCWKKLQESQPLLEMASSPLLLTLLCITYDERQDFPSNRALLYGRAIDALLNRWDASRRIKRDKLYKDLDEPRLLNLLSRLAAGYFEANVYFFREEDLHQQIGNFLADLFGEESRSKGALVLQDIEQHYGLIVRRSQYAFSFSHLTFMEYFTAQYVVDKAGSGALNGLIESHFRVDRWLEVFVLTAGKLGHGADEYLLEMQRKNRELLQDVPELEALLRAIQAAIIPGESKYSKAGREAIAAFLALDPALDRARTRALGLGIDRGAFDFDFVRARTLDLALVRDRALDLARALDRAFDRALDRALDLDHLALDRALDRAQLKAYYMQANNLNIQILVKTSNYLKGNLWIVKCLNSGATISAKVREQVLAGLFKPESE